jgi:hypothetical protein
MSGSKSAGGRSAMGDGEAAKLAMQQAIATLRSHNAWLQSSSLVAEHRGEARRFGAGGDQGDQANYAARIDRRDNGRYVSGKMTRAGHQLDQVMVEFAEGPSIGCDEARNV